MAKLRQNRAQRGHIAGTMIETDVSESDSARYLGRKQESDEIRLGAKNLIGKLTSHPENICSKVSSRESGPDIDNLHSLN